MSIVLARPSNPRTRSATKTASTAYSADSAICLDEDASGAAFTAATTTTIRIAGILQAAVAATDSDYATSGARKNYVVDEDGEWLVTADAADANDEGGYVDFASSTGLAMANSTYDPFLVLKYISATSVRGLFTAWQGRYGPAAD